MPPGQEKFWLSQLHLANRNSVSLKSIRYRRSSQNIWHGRLKYLTSSSSTTSKPPVHISLHQRFSSSPVKILPSIFLQDINHEDAIFKFCKTIGPRAKASQAVKLDGTDLHLVTKRSTEAEEVENWDVISSLFKNKLDPHYGLESDELTAFHTNYPHQEMSKQDDHSFFTTEISLSVKRKDQTTIDIIVSWPALEQSLGCRGIGILPLKYRELVDEGIVTITHPLTGNDIPVFEYNAIPEGCDAIGLFPSLLSEHAKLFTGSLMVEKVLPFRTCTKSEVSHLRNFVKSADNKAGHSDSFTANVSQLEDVDSALNSTVYSISRLLGSLNSGSLQNTKPNYRRQMCSTDILRATVISGNITDGQLKEEYAKISILYSIFQHHGRLISRMSKAKSQPADIIFKPWDEVIVHEMTIMNKTPKPKSVKEMFADKKSFDSFLYKLNTYNNILVSELRSQAHEKPENTIPRISGMAKVLGMILSNCQWIQYLYPNLSFVLNRKIPQKNTENIPSLGDLKLGDRVFMIIADLLDAEETVYQEFNKEERGEMISISDWLQDYKIVLLIGKTLEPDIKRVLQFATKINMQICDNLEDASRVSFSECISKKLVAENTYLYLYKTKKVPSDTGKQIAHLLQKLGVEVN